MGNLTLLAVLAVASTPCERLPTLLPPVAADLVVERIDSCRVVEVLAVHHYLEPETLVALAWHESRFAPRALSSGWAMGLLQVIPGTCKRWLAWGRPRGFTMRPPLYLTPGGCDLLAAGAWTFGRFQERSPTLRWAVCRYSKGYDCDPVKTALAWRWAGAVVRLRNRLVASR